MIRPQSLHHDASCGSLCCGAVCGEGDLEAWITTQEAQELLTIPEQLTPVASALQQSFPLIALQAGPQAGLKAPLHQGQAAQQNRGTHKKHGRTRSQRTPIDRIRGQARISQADRARNRLIGRSLKANSLKTKQRQATPHPPGCFRLRE